MGYLKLHQPHLSMFDGQESNEFPQVLPFHLHAPRMRKQQGGLNLVSRARVLSDNRECPDCCFPMVEPLELEDGLVNRNRQTIPGTATIVGFRCQRCCSEWPA